jgi:quercetin dioxygenase-like cupin family protein
MAIVQQGPSIKEGLNDFLGQLHHFSDGLYAKEMHIPANHCVVSHKHEYSHFSILAQGEVVVEVDENTKHYTAPACVEIKAGAAHKIFAIKDATWFCVHATSETDVDKVDSVLIAKGVEYANC